MFNSIYSEKLTQYYNLRRSVLSESAKQHELCYLRRFDYFLNENISGMKITQIFNQEEQKKTEFDRFCHL